MSTVYFMAVPAIYLSFRALNYVGRASLFSVLALVPFMTMIEYVAQTTRQWAFPPSIFPFKIFDVVILEVVLGMLFNAYYVVIFYEYFLDKHFSRRLWSPHMKYLIYLIFAFVLPFTFLLYFVPTVLNIPHFYFWFGIFLILLPVLLQIWLNPSILPKFFKTAAYFFYLSFIYEIIALKLGWWYFPATDYVGWISLLGVSFPIEEFLHWIALFALAILTYYEFFECDEK